MSAESLAAFLTRARTRVDASLERYLPVPPACPAIVADAMRYSVFAGGKRLRPILTLAAAVAADDRRPEGTNVATDISAAWLMSASTTEAPASANARAMARPMPELAPVTRATWPVKSYLGFIGSSCSRRSDVVVGAGVMGEGADTSRKTSACAAG